MSYHNKVINYLDQALGEGTSHNTAKGLQISYKCPFCDDHKERLFVNISKQVFYCHHCEVTGSLITFISQYAHIPWEDALKIYRSYEGYSQPLPDSLEDEIYARLSHIIQIPQEKVVHPLPEEYIPMTQASGKAGKKAISYLMKRGVSLEMAERYSIGYCAEGTYSKRIIMPDFEDGKLIYWQARTWKKEPTDKFKQKYFRKVLNPSLSEEQVEQGVIAVDKSEVISNIDTILEQGTAVICEGRFDAYTLGNIGGCIHGKHMSDAQFMKLVMNKDKIDVVAVMLDGDALRNAISLAERLDKHFDTVLICKLPKDQDPNTLGVRGCINALNNAITYSPMFGVKARIQGWV